MGILVPSSLEIATEMKELMREIEEGIYTGLHAGCLIKIKHRIRTAIKRLNNNFQLNAT